MSKFGDIIKNAKARIPVSQKRARIQPRHTAVREKAANLTIKILSPCVSIGSAKQKQGTSVTAVIIEALKKVWHAIMPSIWLTINPETQEASMSTLHLAPGLSIPGSSNANLRHSCQTRVGKDLHRFGDG